MTGVLKGRPQDTAGRLEKEIRTYDLLDALKIPYERVDHEAHNTIEACAQVDQLLQIEICKNLFLCNRQETDFYLLMLPGGKQFKTKDLSHQLGVARLSFGKPEYMEKFLDITPGSVSVMGLMNDVDHRVQLLIDEEVAKEEYVGCHPCINTVSIKLKTSDLLEKFLPRVGHEPVFVRL
ncbi:MAG: prolyl-tRNA synthetase associated domain-containing protein [Ruminococcus sp.]|jgi:Ala-tRNA(Pro) deacylase